MSNPLRYCLFPDNSGHIFCIPVSRKNEFEAWVEKNEDYDCSEYGDDDCEDDDCEEGDEWEEEPSYAVRLEGSHFTFTDPIFV